MFLTRAREVVQWLRVLLILPEDPSSLTNTEGTAAHNCLYFSSRDRSRGAGVVSHRVGAKKPNPGLLQEQPLSLAF